MNNPYSFQVYEPMKVAKAPNNYLEFLKNEKILGTIKKDGYWETIIKENNQVYMFSRSVSKTTGFYSEKIDNVPHLKNWAMKNLPNGTCLIGEAYYPGGTSKDVTKILGCLSNKAIERQAGSYGNLHYYIHDLLKYNGYDYVVNQVPYSKRYSDLCKYIDIQAEHIPEVEVAGIWDSVYCNLAKVTEQELLDGEEGMVFRTESGLYLPGKRRPNIMFKIKESIDTIDLVITDLLDPEMRYTGKDVKHWPYWVEYNPENPEEFWEIPVANIKASYVAYNHLPESYIPVTKAYYLGWKNAFELSAYDNNGTLIPVARVASGLTDQMREDIAKHPDNYLGKVCSISAMSVDPQELSIRHPVFIDIRYDKDPKECKIKDIF